MQVLCEYCDGAAIVWIILAYAGTLIIQTILGRILLWIVARLAEVLVVVTLVVGVSSIQYVATQLLSAEVDLCDAPALQVIHTETFSEKLASTLTAHLATASMPELAVMQLLLISTPAATSAV